MSQTIDWTTSIEVPGGKDLVVSRSVKVEAIGRIHVTISVADGETKVEVQPGSSAGQVKFLAVTSDTYKGLTYKVNSGGTAWKLDEPLIVAGDGVMEALDPTDSAPQNLFFTLTSAKPTDKANIEILVGRDATP